MLQLSEQIACLFVLALPTACISWTVTHEEVFKEPRNFCFEKSKSCNSIWNRKFYYLFTCEYCFSHYVALAFMFITRYHLLFPDWRGYLIGYFALVWISNIYMSIFGFVRVGMKKEKMDAEIEDLKLREIKKGD